MEARSHPILDIVEYIYVSDDMGKPDPWEVASQFQPLVTQREILQDHSLLVGKHFYLLPGE